MSIVAKSLSVLALLFLLAFGWCVISARAFASGATPPDCRDGARRTGCAKLRAVVWRKRVAAPMFVVLVLVVFVSSSSSSLGSRGGIVLPMMVTRLQSTNHQFSVRRWVMSGSCWVSRALSIALPTPARALTSVRERRRWQDGRRYRLERKLALLVESDHRTGRRGS
jgi:hypothetical protein